MTYDVPGMANHRLNVHRASWAALPDCRRMVVSLELNGPRYEWLAILWIDAADGIALALSVAAGAGTEGVLADWIEEPERTAGEVIERLQWPAVPAGTQVTRVAEALRAVAAG